MHSSNPSRRTPARLLCLGLAAVVGLGLGCSGSKGSQRLRVGDEPAGQGGGGGGAGIGGNAPDRDGGPTGDWQALSVRVEDIDDVAIELITLSCAADCAEVEAVASGGNPPYTYAWEDGSTEPVRTVCIGAGADLSVRATDTALVADEFHYEAHTASTQVRTTVLECGDGGGVPADAGPNGGVYWTTWTAVTEGAPGSASGYLEPPGGDVDVSYDGQVISGSAITGQQSVLPVVAVVTFTPEATFTSATVPNGPPPSGMIYVDGSAATNQTIRFSAPVRDPLIAVLSLGNFGVSTTWSFDGSVTLLSSGAGIVNMNGPLNASGQDVVGSEGNGVVELRGIYTEITFSITNTDSSAFTVGIRGRE